MLRNPAKRPQRLRFRYHGGTLNRLELQEELCQAEHAHGEPVAERHPVGMDPAKLDAATVNNLDRVAGVGAAAIDHGAWVPGAM